MLNKFFVSLFLITSLIFSAYLNNVPQVINQPDGSTIELDGPRAIVLAY